MSFQLLCEEDVLPSAFEDRPPRGQAAAAKRRGGVHRLRHDWRRLGISAEEVREFCVRRNAPMRALSSQGDLVDSYDPALERRTVCFLAFVPGQGKAGASTRFSRKDLRKARRQL